MHRSPRPVGPTAALLAAIGVAPPVLQAQTPYLVKNINAITDSVQSVPPVPPSSLSDSNPTGFVRVGGKTFFIAAGANKGNELWVIDGPGVQPRLVKDINPGSTAGVSGQLLPFNGGVLFSGTDAASGSELWFSDGTEAGTQRLLDINPGTAASVPNTFVDMGTYVLFTANNGATNGNELWRTDGTAAGTFMVKDIFPGASASSPAGTRRVGNFAYFRAQGSLESGGTNFELWRTDGTDAGTFLVKNIRVATSSGTGSSSPDGFTEYNGFVYFAANTGTTAGRSGIELWRTDGTDAGTTQVSDINPGTGNGMGNTPSFVVLNNKLYFFASPPGSGFELCSYDDVNGVQVVFDANGTNVQSNPSKLTLVGSQLYYTVAFIPSGSSVVGNWVAVSDGTTAGSSLLTPVAGGFEAINTDLVAHAGRVYFGVDPVINGNSAFSELWSTDGTTAGTALFVDIGPAGDSARPQSLFSTPAELLFSAYTAEVGRELWISDGTPGATSLLSDLNPGDFSGSGIASMGELNGKLIFSASDGISGKELWTSDGTAAGTFLLKDIGPGASGSDPADPATTFPDGFVPFNGKLYFNALQQNVTGIELWSTDGTADGTTLLKDINTVDQTDFAPEPTGMTVLNGKLVFRARQPFVSTGGAGENGSELWESDGTTDGTQLLVDIRPGGTDNLSSSSTPQFITFFDRPGTDPDWIFFAATGSTSQGNELWRSDGTAAGTVLVKDIRPTASPSHNSSPNNLAVIGGKLFFGAINDVGNEPYVSDGTDPGTFPLANINQRSATAASDPSVPIDLNGIAIFSATSDSSGAGTGIAQPLGRELYRSDGTPGGTSRILDINPGTANGIASNATFVRLGAFIYFAATTATNGTELWRTDGTTAGTTMFADINPGSGSSSPSSLKVIDGVLYFAATDGTSTGGVEPYRTDGVTPPVRIANINPDGSSSPSLFTKAGTRVYFTASAGPDGAELWAIDFTPYACCTGSSCTLLTTDACTLAGGVVQTGTTCSPSPCAPPASVVCCRGATCVVVASAGDCTVPAGPVVGASVSPAAACGVANNASTGCCFADFNKSAAANIDDIFIFLNAWFASSPFTDVNGDGTSTPNIDDIFIFLNLWFAGCP
jgi:ELWxxDGT repeat protein